MATMQSDKKLSNEVQNLFNLIFGEECLGIADKNWFSQYQLIMLTHYKITL